MSELAALHAIVLGRVQGVNYRAFTQRYAISLDLVGYVRNLPDRSVEVYVEGKKDKLEQLLQVLQKGPSYARVDSIKSTWLEYTGKYREFSVAD
jgi:acylphosphatase